MESIYSLANYENSGFLLEQCRKLLPNLATDGAGTNPRPSKGRSNGVQLELSWTNLLEKQRADSQTRDQIDELYQIPVLKLMSKLEAAIR